jgi:hypothetical protein
VEGRRGCAVEHGRRRRELTSAREYRGDSAEEIGRRDFVPKQGTRTHSTPKCAENSSSNKWFHAAAATGGQERNWASAGVSLSMTTIGPPHLGQRQGSRESLVDETPCSACGSCAAPSN